MRIHAVILSLAVALLLPTPAPRAQDGPDATAGSPVTAQDSGVKMVRNGWIAGHTDHTWQEQVITLSSDLITYSIKYRACVDDSHPGVCFRDEGFIGMPGPNVANWYHTGFFHIEFDGKELGSHPLADMRVTESGGRGAFHMVWDTPDYLARLRFVLEPGSDHLLSLLTCEPKNAEPTPSVTVSFTCYPSFFTTAHHRQGDRTVTTPRTTVHEIATVELVPAADTYLLYSDGIFDVAKGEGSGPCAMMFLPEQIAAGSVEVTGYPVQTRLEPVPGTRQLRFAFWDMTGKTNAEAQAIMAAGAAGFQQHLREASFRSESLERYDPAAAEAEVDALLIRGGEDGVRLRPTTEDFMAALSDLKLRADRGEWQAEADFARRYPEYEALIWKLRIFALLNRP